MLFKYFLLMSSILVSDSLYYLVDRMFNIGWQLRVMRLTCLQHYRIAHIIDNDRMEYLSVANLYRNPDYQQIVRPILCRWQNGNPQAKINYWVCAM